MRYQELNVPALKNKSGPEYNTGGFYYTEVEDLRKTGFTKKRIMQIIGENYWRIFDKAVTVYQRRDNIFSTFVR